MAESPESFAFPKADISEKGHVSKMDLQIDQQIEIDVAAEQKKKEAEILEKKAKDTIEKQKKAAEKAARRKIPLIKRIFKKKHAGPMGVTDISKMPIRLNIPEEAKKSLFILAECIIIGFLVNIMFSNFNFKIGLLESVGWAISWWVIKFKMPVIIRSYK